MGTEKFEKKAYVSEMTMQDSQTYFKYRSYMTDVKFNYKNDQKYSRELWQCDSCLSAIETQSHILWCPTYQALREGKDIRNDDDLVKYISEVMNAREKLGITK